MELKTPWSDGTASLTFTAEELVERLAALVPQPSCDLVLYHGVLAGRHGWRSEVIPALEQGRRVVRQERKCSSLEPRA